MRLSSDLSYDFPSYIRARGADYYKSGAVRLDQASETLVKARVHGARHYKVEIECTPKTLTLQCDCPYFDSTGPCKHLWATILAAEAKGHLSEATTVGRERVSYGYDYEDDDDVETITPPFPTRPQPMPIAPRPKPPKWREHLQQIANTEPSSPQIWPAERQVLYV